MEKQEKETFKKGFNHGYVLSSVPSSDKVVEQLIKVAEKSDSTSTYANGFNSGIKQQRKEKTMGKGVSRLRETLGKKPLKSVNKTITKKPPTKGR